MTRQEGPESLGQLDREAMPAAPGTRRSLPAHAPHSSQEPSCPSQRTLEVSSISSLYRGKENKSRERGGALPKVTQRNGSSARGRALNSAFFPLAGFRDRRLLNGHSACLPGELFSLAVPTPEILTQLLRYDPGGSNPAALTQCLQQINCI